MCPEECIWSIFGQMPNLNLNSRIFSTAVDVVHADAHVAEVVAHVGGVTGRLICRY